MPNSDRFDNETSYTLEGGQAGSRPTVAQDFDSLDTLAKGAEVKEGEIPVKKMEIKGKRMVD